MSTKPIRKSKLTFPGNDKLRNAGARIPLTQYQLEEYIKCKQDFFHFCENYVKILSLDHGIVLFKPRPFQRELYETAERERFVIAKIPRQYGKCALSSMVVRVRSKLTGEIISITIGEFHDLIRNRNKYFEEVLEVS